MGATPHNLAKEASLPSLWGLSLRPRDQQRRGVLGTDARQRDQPRGGLRHQALEVRLQLEDLLGEGLVAAGHPTERELGGRGHVTGTLPESEAGGHRDELLRGEVAQTVAQLLRRRHTQGLWIWLAAFRSWP
jgi:hypothetical protein